MLNRLASVGGLMVHFSVLLVTTSALVLVNLLVSPNTQWGGAILTVWLLVLVAHGLGIVIARLMADESTVFPQPDALPEDDGGGWALAVDPDAAESEGAGTRSMADAWKDATPPDDDSETSWPSVATSEPAPDEAGETAGDAAVANRNADQRVPWRAATEIAWLRKWQDAKDDDETQQRNSAS